MKVRKAGEGDIPAILDMAQEFERYLIGLGDSLAQESPSRATFERVLRAGFDDEKHAILVAEDAGGLVGFADFWAYPEFLHGGQSAYLNNLFVRESHRGRGVGSALLRETMRLAKEKGAVAIHISILKKNVKALEFYRKNGIRDELAMLEKQLDKT